MTREYALQVVFGPRDPETGEPEAEEPPPTLRRETRAQTLARWKGRWGRDDADAG